MMFDWTVVYEIALFALICVVVAALLPWLKERIGAEKLNKIWLISSPECCALAV